MKHTMAFTRGPIVGSLLRFSMPILFALFLQALYGAVDLMVVGKFALAQDVSGVAAGFDYLKAYGIDCLLTCFLFCFIGFYNGLGRTGFVMLQGIAAAFLIRIPVAYIMCQTTGRLFYIGLGIPCSTVFQILLCFAYFSRVRKRR